MPRSLKFKDAIKRSPIPGIEIPRRPRPPPKRLHPQLKTLPQYPILFDQFRQGQKKVFLPNFTLTLLRTPHLPPQYASFFVPLNFSKLDLRDYLFNLYDIRTLRIRSYVQQQKPKKYRFPKDIPNASPIVKWHRPRSIKKMTVELEEGFAWPPEPTDLTPWENELFTQRSEALKEEREVSRIPPSRQENPGAREYAREAKQLLKRQVEWEDVGEAEEVDKDQE